jgi:hypothetical protein
MGRHQNKPWQKRWVPQPGPRVQNAGFTAPATPEGWHRHERTDWCEYLSGTWGNGWRVIGKAGVKWKVYETKLDFLLHDETYVSSDLVFESNSFEACVTFVKIEQSNEPERAIGMDWAGIESKTARLSLGYNTGRRPLKIGDLVASEAAAQDMLAQYRAAFMGQEFTTVVIDEAAQLDFSKLEDRVHARP